MPYRTEKRKIGKFRQQRRFFYIRQGKQGKSLFFMILRIRREKFYRNMKRTGGMGLICQQIMLFYGRLDC